MSTVSHLFYELFPKVKRSSEMPREPLHKIWMRSTQRLIKYRAHKLFGWLFFSKYPPSAILVLIYYSQKLIRSSEIPSEPPHQIWMRSNPWFIRYRAHKLFGRLFFQTAILFLMFFLPKVNQIIRNTQRTITSNLNAIQPPVHEISHPQAFPKCMYFVDLSKSSMVNVNRSGVCHEINILVQWSITTQLL